MTKFLTDLDPSLQVPVNWIDEVQPLRVAQDLNITYYDESGKKLDVRGEIVFAKTTHESDPANLMALPSLHMKLQWFDKNNFTANAERLKEIHSLIFEGGLESEFYTTEVILNFNTYTCEIKGSNEFVFLNNESYHFDGFLSTKYFDGGLPRAFDTKHINSSLRSWSHKLPIGYRLDRNRNALESLRHLYQLNGFRVLYVGRKAYITNKYDYDAIDYKIPQCAIYNQINELKNPIQWDSISAQSISRSDNITSTRIKDDALIYERNRDYVYITLPSIFSEVKIGRASNENELYDTKTDKSGLCRVPIGYFDRLNKSGSGEWIFVGHTIQITPSSTLQSGKALTNPYNTSQHTTALMTLMRFKDMKKLSFEMRNSPFLPVGATVKLEYPDESENNPTKHSWRDFYISKIERDFEVGCKMKVEGYLGGSTEDWVLDDIFTSIKARWDWNTYDSRPGYRLEWMVKAKEEFELLGVARRTSYRIHRTKDGVKTLLGEVPHPSEYWLDPIPYDDDASDNMYYTIDVVFDEEEVLSLDIHHESVQITSYGYVGAPNAMMNNPHLRVDYLSPTKVEEDNTQPRVHYRYMGQWANVLNKSSNVM